MPRGSRCRLAGAVGDSYALDIKPTIDLDNLSGGEREPAGLYES